ncbi:hypothetical protein AKJ62_02775 [candidate division MSBL1 archaeon SCGC-AAA259D14]|uniref:Metalloenzyme domain-containing protein n=1 Tax=candidate division MSBL1 archaeon SCGC-AAA259D14 TaxID=1698261 RepID=A0A133U5Z7_9EURY|nr:hypothetical protein AKJ62_02775 [candidate division MSBL1 archaeon SCGC-AAA259D14]
MTHYHGGGWSDGKIGKGVILAIIDSLDWFLYEKFGRSIIEDVFSGSVEEFKVFSSADKTSPSIATILTGLDPEEHHVFSTQNAKESGIINLPEFAEKNGVKSTVVMERAGALTFLKILEMVTPVEDRENIVEFDEDILSGVEESVEGFKFIVCHLRTLDEQLHRGESVEKIEEGLERIIHSIINIAREGEFLLIITGDHKCHGNGKPGGDDVPGTWYGGLGSSRRNRPEKSRKEVRNWKSK